MNDHLVETQRMIIGLQESQIKLLKTQVDARDQLIETLEKMCSNQEQQIAILIGKPIKPKLILIDGGLNE